MSEISAVDKGYQLNVSSAYPVLRRLTNGSNGDRGATEVCTL